MLKPTTMPIMPTRSESQGASRGHRHFPVPCQYAASWLLNFIQPLASTIKDKMEGNAQELAACVRVLRDLEQIVDLEHQGGGYQALHGDGYQGLDHKLVPLAQMTQTGVIWLPQCGQRSPSRPRPKPNPNCLQFELPLRTII